MNSHKHISAPTLRTCLYLFAIPQLLILLIILGGCSAEKDPERLATAFVEQFEHTIETRDLRSIRALISENYQDDHGRSRQDIAATAAGYILRNKSIHIYTRLTSANRDDTIIEASVLAAVAGKPIEDLALLPSLNADMYWVDFAVDITDGDPLLVRASWRQAMLDDFLAE